VGGNAGTFNPWNNPAGIASYKLTSNYSLFGARECATLREDL
jgi:hypothetical protein